MENMNSEMTERQFWGIVAIGAIVLGSMLFITPTRSAYAVPRPPRPEPRTVQRVEIFTCTKEPAYECADRLKGQYERWVKSASDVHISDRQVSVGVGQSDAGSYGGHRDTTVVMTLSVFYERLVERPADEKPPAEKP